ncbi:hypothetical protein KKA14_04850, partial [bacterium]|nr:hypothetical protein [bacterium]
MTNKNHSSTVLDKIPNLPIVTFILFLLVLLSSLTQAAPRLDLTDQQNMYDLALYLDLLEDPKGVLTIEHVSSKEMSEHFKANTNKVLNFKFSQSIHWARLNVRNLSKETVWYIYQFYSSGGFADHVDLYLLQEDGSFKTFREGQSIPVINRRTPDSFASFALSITYNENKTIYLRVKDEGLFFLPLYMRNMESIKAGHIYTTIPVFILLGAIIFFLVYNFLLFSSLRDSIILFYNLVLVCLLLSLLKVIFLAFFDFHVWWANRLEIIIADIFFPM